MDCGAKNGDFAVTTMKSLEVVRAALAPKITYEYWLPMSNLDLLIPPLDVGVFFCFNNKNNVTISPPPPQREKRMVSVIKQALSKTLVSFYPFAGEVVRNGYGEPEICCNNRGVNFMHAYADIELKDLDFHRPDVTFEGKMIPENSATDGKVGVLSVQVTELKCGGVVVGCTFDHRVADAYSANMFLVAWGDTARTNHTDCVPSFRRSLLNPRRPPSYCPSIDHIYSLRSTKDNETKFIQDRQRRRLVSRIYYVPWEQIALLQSLANTGNGPRWSKLESFSAFLWKTVAQGCNGGDDAKRCRLGVVVDGRQRMKSFTSAMQNYFGNVLSVPYSEASVAELKRMPLSMAVEMVHESLENAAREAHFRALIDWVELHRPEQAMVRVGCKEDDDKEEQEAAIVVSSGLRFPMSQVDLGWGVPVFGSYHFPWGGETGYVMPMASVHCNGDWIVYAHLLKRHLHVLETQAAHIFKPFNFNHIS